MIYCDVMTHMSKKEFCSLIVGITRRAQRQKVMLNSNFPPKKKKKEVCVHFSLAKLYVVIALVLVQMVPPGTFELFTVC